MKDKPRNDDVIDINEVSVDEEPPEPENHYNKKIAVASVTFLLVLLILMAIFGSSDEKAENSGDQGNGDGSLDGEKDFEAPICMNYEYLTDKGCVECGLQIENCKMCYSFEGTSDGTPLYKSPIYESKESMEAKSFLACEFCQEGYKLDFWRQQCDTDD